MGSFFWKLLFVRHFYVHLCQNEYSMEIQSNKTERIEIRISSYDKQIFQKAQKLSGDKTFSSFIVRILKEQAEEIVSRKERIIVSQRDRERFFEAVFSDAHPNQNLTEAAERFKSKSKEL